MLRAVSGILISSRRLFPSTVLLELTWTTRPLRPLPPRRSTSSKKLFALASRCEKSCLFLAELGAAGIEPADNRRASRDEDWDCEFWQVRRAALGTRWLS